MIQGINLYKDYVPTKKIAHICSCINALLN